MWNYNCLWTLKGYRFRLQISYKYIKNFTAIFSLAQYLSTADIDVFIRPFVDCAFLFAMATPVRKTFITDVGGGII